PPEVGRATDKTLQPAGEERAFGNDGGIALGAGGDHADFDLQEIGDEAEIVERGFRQLAGVFHTIRRIAPAGHGFAFGSDPLMFLGECGHFVDPRGLVFVAGADLDFALGIEDIELSDDERVDAVDHLGVAQNSEVEPAAAAWPAGNSTKLLATLADFLRFNVGHFSRERTAADPRGVSLGHADYMLDASW